MEPIQVELVGSSPIPWEMIIPAVTALFAALISGYGGYVWQGRNQSKHMEFQSKQQELARLVHVRELMLLPVRNAFRDWLAAAEAFHIHLPDVEKDVELSSAYIDAGQSFLKQIHTVSDEELNGLFLAAIQEITDALSVYIDSDKLDEDREAFDVQWSKAEGTITRTSMAISGRIETLISLGDLN